MRQPKFRAILMIGCVLLVSFFPTYLYDDAQPFILPGNDGQGVGKTYAQELIQNDMIQWVRKHAKDPFLLFYAITLNGFAKMR